jgi:hypothetical protein
MRKSLGFLRYILLNGILDSLGILYKNREKYFFSKSKTKLRQCLITSLPNKLVSLRI